MTDRDARGRSALRRVRLHARATDSRTDPEAARLPDCLRCIAAGDRRVVSALVLCHPLLLGAGGPGRRRRACPGSAPRGARRRAGPGGGVRLRSSSSGRRRAGTSGSPTPLVRPRSTKARPFRVDILIRDPSVPSVRCRLLPRAQPDRPLRRRPAPGRRILLLPERGQNVFLPPTIDGDRLTFQVPGRILSADEDRRDVAGSGSCDGPCRARRGLVRSCWAIGRPHLRFSPMAIAGPPVADRRPREPRGRYGWSLLGVGSWIAASGRSSCGAAAIVLRRSGRRAAGPDRLAVVRRTPRPVRPRQLTEHSVHPAGPALSDRRDPIEVQHLAGSTPRRCRLRTGPAPRGPRRSSARRRPRARR